MGPSHSELQSCLELSMTSKFRQKFRFHGPSIGRRQNRDLSVDKTTDQLCNNIKALPIGTLAPQLKASNRSRMSITRQGKAKPFAAIL